MMKGKQRCLKCNINTSSENSYKKHILTKKHINNCSESPIYAFRCGNCEKIFKSRPGYSSHKKLCKDSIKSEETDTNKTDLDVIKQMLVEVKIQHESTVNLLKDQILLSNEQIHSRLDSMSELKQPTITTINNEITNNNNNTFNINVFLNEKCHEAINLDDFMKNIVYELGDFKKVLEDYVGGSMSIIKNNMKQIPLNKRPMHYLEGEDNNQQVFHIRQNDIWKMETEINWLKQIDADDDDELEKQTLYFALKKLDHDKLEYLRYNFSANHDYMKNHKRLNCEVTRVDLKKKLYKEIIDLITLDPRMDV